MVSGLFFLVVFRLRQGLEKGRVDLQAARLTLDPYSEKQEEQTPQKRHRIGEKVVMFKRRQKSHNGSSKRKEGRGLRFFGSSRDNKGRGDGRTMGPRTATDTLHRGLATAIERIWRGGPLRIDGKAGSHWLRTAVMRRSQDEQGCDRDGGRLERQATELWSSGTTGQWLGFARHGF